MNTRFDTIFWVVFATVNLIELFVADNIAERTAPTIWLAAITVIFVIKAATITILNALKEQSSKKEN